MSRYNILGHRSCACGCGVIFSYTTNHKEKRFCQSSHANTHRGDIARQQRKVDVARHRVRRFGAEIRTMLDDDRKLTVEQVAALCARVWRMGYNSGYMLARKAQKRREKVAA